jgi:HPr kinase/phosphorylase
MLVEGPLWLHASAVRLAEFGVIITGPSGAGKSSLALELMFLAGEAGWPTGLIGDDRIGLVAENGSLFGQGHDAISGAIEVRGAGIGYVQNAVRYKLTHAVTLTGHLDRMPSEPVETSVEWLGLRLHAWRMSQRAGIASAILLGLTGQLRFTKP